MRRLIAAAAIGISLAGLLPSTVLAQQAADTVVRNRTLERLRARTPLISPDTTPADTVALPDSLRPPPQQQIELVPDSAAGGAAGLASTDSVARLFMRLGGYVLTEYQAPLAHYSADSATLRLIGESSVTREGQILNADSSIIYYEQTGFACGFGAPSLEGEGLDAPLASDSLCYDVNRRVGRAYGLQTSVTEGATWYVRGQCWTVEDRLYCHDTIFTDCDEEEPHTHYHFRANEVKITPGNVLVARDVTLHFADVPVFWLPVMMQSMERGRRSGILFPEFGIGDIARTSSGYNRRINNIGVFWAISDYMGLKLAGGWEANNYTTAELGFEYNVLRQFLTGGLTVNRYWLDTGRRDLTLATTNSWRPNERTSIQANGRYTSSTQFVQERTYDPRELNRSIDSNASLNRRFDWGSASIGASRKQFLTDETVDLQLPGLSLTITPVTLFEAPTSDARWYNNVNWGGTGRFDMRRQDIADSNRDPRRSTRGLNGQAQHSLQVGNLQLSQSANFTGSDLVGRDVPTDSVPITLPDSSTQRLQWTTSLSFQQRLFGTTTLTPNLTFTGETQRVESFGGESPLTREVAAPTRMNFGASLGTDLFGFYPGVGPFERFRHRISPSFGYSYSPKPDVSAEQEAFYGLTNLRETNGLTLTLRQSFEAKYRAQADSAAGADSAAAADTTTGPRRREPSRIITLLSISTSAIQYDFVSAREEGEGLRTTSLSNTLSTDLLPNFSLNVSHDLFERDAVPDDAPEGTVGKRKFSPFLTRASFGFQLNSDSWIARMLRLSPRVDEEAEDSVPGQPADSLDVPAAEQAAQGDITDWQTGPDERLIGSGGVREQRSRRDDRVGSWSANFDYVLSRRRPRPGTDRDPGDSQTLRGSFRMQPTRFWALSWATGYDFTDSEFSDHVLTLTRTMHDFDANFDFLKAQNGNFTFQFRVQLRANPDLKVDYTQRDLNRTPGLR